MAFNQGGVCFLVLQESSDFYLRAFYFKEKIGNNFYYQD